MPASAVRYPGRTEKNGVEPASGQRADTGVVGKIGYLCAGFIPEYNNSPFLPGVCHRIPVGMFLNRIPGILRRRVEGICTVPGSIRCNPLPRRLQARVVGKRVVREEVLSDLCRVTVIWMNPSGCMTVTEIPVSASITATISPTIADGSAIAMILPGYSPSWGHTGQDVTPVHEYRYGTPVEC